MYRFIASTHRHGIKSFLFEDERDFADRLGVAWVQQGTLLEFINEEMENPRHEYDVDDDDRDLMTVEATEVIGTEIRKSLGRSPSDTEMLVKVFSERVDASYFAVDSERAIIDAISEASDDWHAYRVVDVANPQEVIHAYTEAPAHNFFEWRDALRGDLPDDVVDWADKGDGLNVEVPS